MFGFEREVEGAERIEERDVLREVEVEVEARGMLGPRRRGARLSFDRELFCIGPAGG